MRVSCLDCLQDTLTAVGKGISERHPELKQLKVVCVSQVSQLL